MLVFCVHILNVTSFVRSGYSCSLTGAPRTTPVLLTGGSGGSSSTASRTPGSLSGVCVGGGGGGGVQPGLSSSSPEDQSPCSGQGNHTNNTPHSETLRMYLLSNDIYNNNNVNLFYVT